MSQNPSFFYNKLINWYLQNKRDLPWRNNTNPYCIWLSEVILQQTRVNQGLPYYLSFIKAFPTVFDLAKAKEEKVLKLWQGLGYYSRARNLHFTAKKIANESNGVFPNNYDGLLKLKGVGDYTASAIASICYGQPTAVVDGNVYRVLSRVFGIDTPINSSKGVKEFKELAQRLLPTKNVGDYNQSIMEFGAKFCVPKNPNCSKCIFSDKCEALRLNKVSQWPVKIKKQKAKKVYFNYIVGVTKDNKTFLEQRTEKGIWQNLYQFPLIESSTEIVSIEKLKKNTVYRELKDKCRISSISLFNKKCIVHKLSHRHIYTNFWIAEMSLLDNVGVSFNRMKKYPVPVLISNFISEFSGFRD